jgi:hypothetical protein
VPLELAPHDAVFVVFRQAAERRVQDIAEAQRKNLARLTGPWSVRFQPKRGAPEKTTLPELRSWTQDDDPGIKYFSGTAAYDITFGAPESWLAKGQRVEIDLGVVKSIAEVMVNDISAGIVWRRPFRVDVTRLLRPGANKLSVRVTNLWPNRLIGDKQPNVKPVAFTTYNPYESDSPLIDSGLLGPVTVQGLTVGSKEPQRH